MDFVPMIYSIALTKSGQLSYILSRRLLCSMDDFEEPDRTREFARIDRSRLKEPSPTRILQQSFLVGRSVSEISVVVKLKVDSKHVDSNSLHLNRCKRNKTFKCRGSINKGMTN